MGNRGFYGMSRGKERALPKEGIYVPPYSLEFNGTNQWVSTGILTHPMRFTISACVKPSVTAQSSPTILGKFSFYAVSQTDFPVTLFLNSAGTIVTFTAEQGNDFSPEINLSLPIIASAWNRICASFDGQRGILIANGAVVTQSATFNPPAGSRNWSLARTAFEAGGGANNSYFKGKMSDVRIFTRAKSIEDCLRISYGEVDYEYLHVWYPFTDGSGSVLTDVAGSMNGALQNSPTWSTDTP